MCSTPGWRSSRWFLVLLLGLLVQVFEWSLVGHPFQLSLSLPERSKCALGIFYACGIWYCLHNFFNFFSTNDLMSSVTPWITLGIFCTFGYRLTCQTSLAGTVLTVIGNCCWNWLLTFSQMFRLIPCLSINLQNWSARPSSSHLNRRQMFSFSPFSLSSSWWFPWISWSV